MWGCWKAADRIARMRRKKAPIPYLYLMRIGFLSLILLLAVFVSAQDAPTQEKFWIMFRDKGAAQWRPQDILSPKALARRAQHGVMVTARDCPVDAAYLAAVRATGAEVRHPSRWFNAVSAWLTPGQVAAVQALPMVSGVRPIVPVLRDLDPVTPSAMRIGYTSGQTGPQLDMIGLDQLHQNGFNGEGVLIAVMDNGFVKANENPALTHLFDGGRILATRDFVNDEEDVFDGGSHGQWVLTIIAGFSEGEDPSMNYYGSAHGADFILCHTESDASETSQEEDNWVAAMEFADSIGAQVFSTSLGYRDFDGGFDYGYAGMDGNTTIITRAGDYAASIGIVVVNSAGNSGMNKISAPADGDSVIAIGAVDSTRMISGFSSRGPSFDGRVKPDLCAMGVQTAYFQSSGTMSRGNGTSFSCPVISGMAACLLQATSARNMDLYDALIRSADRYDNPDDDYGYGIPDGPRTYTLLTGKTLLGGAGAAVDAAEAPICYPNPATDRFAIAIDNELPAYEARFDLYDVTGRKVWSRKSQISPFFNLVQFERAKDYPNLPEGQYFIRIVRDSDDILQATTKVMIRE
jgi:serine protease AprX